MITPQEEQPATQQAAAPTVSTAPPRSRWRLGGAPGHLGRARTSTVVLGVLFVLVAALWIGVRPDTVTAAQTTGATTGGQVQQPALPARTTTPSRTTVPSASTTAPSTTPTRTTTGTPSGSTTAGSTAGSTAATSSGRAPGTGEPTGTTGEVPTPVVPTTAPAPTS